MSTIITSVDRHSPAERAGIAAGEQLLTINGHEIIDVLDYRFYGYDTDCRLELREPSGAVRTVSLRKPEGRDLGLNFDTVLMDEMRSCANHCIFCFVDQMPPGMRKTLYFKDDDARLSFLQGNYITLVTRVACVCPREAFVHSCKCCFCCFPSSAGDKGEGEMARVFPIVWRSSFSGRRGRVARGKPWGSSSSLAQGG